MPVFKREDTYDGAPGGYEGYDDYREPQTQAAAYDPTRYEAPATARYNNRGYYVPEQYAASERGQPVMDSSLREPAVSYGRPADNYAAPRTSTAYVPVSRTRSGSVASEASLDREEEEPAARGSDRTVNPSFHARSGSWVQQNMNGYSRPAQTTYGPVSGQYSQQGLYQAGLSPARTAPSVRSGQLSPPRSNVPMQGRAILQDDRSTGVQRVEYGDPLLRAETSNGSRQDTDRYGYQPTQASSTHVMPPVLAAYAIDPALQDSNPNHAYPETYRTIDAPPKTPPLPSSKPQGDLGAAEILLAMASPARMDPHDYSQQQAIQSKNGSGDAETARRHRSNSSLSNTALMFPPPEATPEFRRLPVEPMIRVKQEQTDEDETPYGKGQFASKSGQMPAPPHAGNWRHRRSSNSELDDPFQPPSLHHSDFDPSSSVSRGTGQSPMTPAELGPPVDIRSYRQAPPPAPTFARRHEGGNGRPSSNLAPAPSSPATPLNKITQPRNESQSVRTGYDPRGFMMTPARLSGSPAGMPFSSPNGLDLTHTLGLAPSDDMPESPTWWAGIAGATPDAKLQKRPRRSTPSDDGDVLGGMASPTKKIRGER